jgi:hypothetical protein
VLSAGLERHGNWAANTGLTKTSVPGSATITAQSRLLTWYPAVGALASVDSEKERHAQEGQVSCLKSQSQEVAELGFKPRPPGSRALLLNCHPQQVPETQDGCHLI